MSMSETELEQRITSRLMDVLIRMALIFILAMLCYKIFAPFLSLMVWAVILAVTLYPLHQLIAGKLGGKQGRAATLLVLLGLVVIVGPTAVLTSSLGDSVHDFVVQVQNNTLEIPAPRESVASWPFVGEKIHTLWGKAYSDLPALIQSQQPKIGELTKGALSFVAGIGLGILQFIASLVIAGILMAFGQAGARGSLAIFSRIAGNERGAEFTKLSTQTIRAVAQGVLGVAMIQAIIIGFCLIIAGVPWAGALSAIVLVLGIAQAPAVIVTLPAIGYIWSSGSYGNVEAIAYSVLLFVAGLADNVLKPLLLGRGVDAPMPVILIGALGGMAAKGILGMFVGATLLALGYQIFMGWVYADPDAVGSEPEETPIAN
ncbi:MAG TPA: AI-2E family transporter [Pseudomonadales bacterium]|nr:AI-2E family transporter [Pseudomonadales bacterium]